jgi:predicted RNA binding protein YcfA (HicA-like mRNA interferase family)
MMATHIIKPVKLNDYFAFLTFIGCRYARTKGSHYVFFKAGLNRPIVVPVHGNEVIPFYIRSNLKTLGMGVEEFLEIMEKIKR